MEKAEEIFSLVRSDVSTELDCSVSVQSLSDNTAELKNLDCTRSEEHTSELQSHVRISYAVFCLKKKT